MNKFIEILKREVVPALGCTEPSAVAYATSVAASLLKNEITKIDLFLSGNIIKNGMGVGVPNTGEIGLHIAAASGAIIKDPSQGLELLKSLDEEKRAKARSLVAQKLVNIQQKSIFNKLYIEAICYSKDEVATVIIADQHTNLVYQEYCGKVVLDKKDEYLIFDANKLKEEEIKDEPKKKELSISEIIDFVKEASFEDLEFLLDGVKLNSAIADEGLKGGYGIELGKSIKDDVKNQILSDDLIHAAMSYSAAATDARMAGSHLSVMSNSGSGNQGLTVFLPIIAVYRKLGIDDQEKFVKALALGNLIAIHIKNHLGRLSALCGVVVAATGASCGISYLLSNSYEFIPAVIKNMTGSVTGMICDGAKPGCSLKVATAVNSACLFALLANKNRVISKTDGIIDECVEKTIRNLCEIGSKGMGETDKMILKIMTCK